MYLATCIVCLFATVTAVFDCGRSTDLCLAGSTCDRTNGRCVCADPTLNGGFDCGLLLASVDAQPCTGAPCANGGSCTAVDALTATCYCPEDFTGNTCQTPRYQLDCGDGVTEMTISITPHGSFSGGIMYIEGDPNCILTQADAGEPYTITLPHTGGDCIDAIPDPPDMRFTRKVVILSNSEQVTGRDEMVTAICSDGTITRTSNITVGVLNQGLQNQNLGVVPVDTDVNFDLTVNSGNSVNDLSLGDNVTVRFSLTEEGNQKYDAFRIEICVATNNLPSNDTDFMTATFIAGSCHTTELESVTSQRLEAGDANNVSFIFEAFKFTVGNKDQLLVTCAIKMCDQSTVTDCAPVTCADDAAGLPTGLGRRRRDAGTEKTVGKILTIKDPFRTQNVPEQPQTNGICSVSGEILGVLVAMAIIIFLLFVACTVLTIRVLFYTNVKHVQDDSVSQSSSTSLATLTRRT